MTFLEAIVKIHERSDLSLCTFAPELDGTRNCICVYQGEQQNFVGKLRWPVYTVDAERNVVKVEPASVDEELIEILEDPQKTSSDITFRHAAFFPVIHTDGEGKFEMEK